MIYEFRFSTDPEEHPEVLKIINSGGFDYEYEFLER